MSARFWKRIVLGIILIPLLLFGALLIMIIWKQDEIVQELISKANEDFAGEIRIADTHISLFENFPYISIDLDHVKVFEDKTGVNRTIDRH
jgi:hypothetical protein